MNSNFPDRVVHLCDFSKGTHFRPWWLILNTVLVAMVAGTSLPARGLDLVRGVEAQPLKAQAERVVQALEYLGSPPNNQQMQVFKEVMDDADAAQSVSAIQELLDSLGLVAVHINPESRVKVQTGPASKTLEDIRRERLNDQPFWHVERVRVGDSSKVPVELIVNGQAVARPEIEADGEVHELEFSYSPDISSWVCITHFSQLAYKSNVCGSRS